MGIAAYIWHNRSIDGKSPMTISLKFKTTVATRHFGVELASAVDSGNMTACNRPERPGVIEKLI